jgi:signal transduction histidine kinase
VTWIFGRRWLSAFDHLDETASACSRGDLSALERSDADAEMDRLQQPSASMITNLQSARESMRAGGRRAADARGAAVAAAAGDSAGALAAIGVLVSGVAHELNNPCRQSSALPSCCNCRRTCRNRRAPT